MSRAHKAWLALLVAATAGLIHIQWNWESGAPAPAERDDSPMRAVGRVAVGVHELEKSAGDRGQTERMIDELDDLELDDADRLRRAIVEAEVKGPEPALKILRATKGEAEDRALLERRYGGQELTEAERARLVERYEWFGRLSNVYGRPDDDPERAELLDSARNAAIVGLTFGASALPAVLLGFVLLIAFVVNVGRGKIRMRFALYDEGSGDVVWLQTVVIGLVIFLALVTGIFEAVGVPGPLQPWLALLALLWPLVRGMRPGEWAGGLGLRGGQGALREIRAGVFGYIGGLPLIVLGYWMTARLSHITGLQPDHPIRQEIGGATPVWFLVLSTVVWAPLVEELLFRGAFYRYLRPSVSVVGAAIISGLLFAALHPQGLAGIPVILSIAVVFAGLREWRGSIYASMTAHALHNGLLLTVAINVVG
jgi:membrane protease YdiL (CAAX protease family)